MAGLVATDRRGADDTAPPGLIQSIDARVRIVASLAFAVVAVSCRGVPVLLLALGLAVLLAALARLPLQPTFRRLAGLDAFMLPLLLFLPFTMPGEPVARIGSFILSGAGITRAAEILLTGNAVMLALLALVGSIEPTRLGHALHGLGLPEKMARLLLLTTRYIAVLHGEYARLRLAMKARAFRARGNRHTWRSLGYLFGMLLVRSFERSERIADAMKCRGFSGRFFIAGQPPLSGADRVFATAMGAGLAGLTTLGFSG